jgi:DNA modification methylase
MVLAVPDYFQTGSIYAGDCKDVLRRFPEACVDLIYLDPPFFSNRHYEVIWNDGSEINSFDDRWKGGIENYVEWMLERIRGAIASSSPLTLSIFTVTGTRAII